MRPRRAAASSLANPDGILCPATAAELEDAIQEACGQVNASVAELMELLWRFSREEGWRWLGFFSLKDWASTDRFPYDANTAYRLVRIYHTFCHQGKVAPERVAATGWTKLVPLVLAVRREKISAAEAVEVATRISRTEVAQLAEDLGERRRTGHKGRATDPMWDIVVPILDLPEAYLHRRLRAPNKAKAVRMAVSEYSSEDLFGIKFGTPKANRIDEAA